MPKQITASLAEHSKKFFLLLTLCVGCLLLLPSIDFQPILAQGDHGHDLYSFEQVLKGKTPYKDFWWVYGPIMPYYYALAYSIFGVTIQSALIGKFILTLLAGIFFYLTMATVITPLFAFLSAVWFFIYYQGFFFTFNHIGGVTVFIAFLYFLFLYIKELKTSYALWSLFFIFILNFIKINFGVCALLVFLVSFFLTNRLNYFEKVYCKKRVYILALLVIPILTLAIYSFFIYDQPSYIIRQCFPYLASDHPHKASVLSTTSRLTVGIFKNIFSTTPNAIFALIINMSFIQVVYKIFKKQYDIRTNNQLTICILTLCLLYILNMHEFIASGIEYRTYWARPFSIMLIFLVIGKATQNFSKIIKFCFAAIVLFMMSLKFSSIIYTTTYSHSKPFYLPLERGQVYLGNPPVWTDALTKTVQHLNKIIPEDELFFALPYDPLYYFLAAKDSPTRQLIFFDHINIPEEQEQKTINDLEANHVNWILLSSRHHATHEPGLGILGKTYCPLIGKYIEDNFEMVAQFGDWTNPAGWAWPHGVKILKRK